MNILIVRYSPYYFVPALERADSSFLVHIEGDKHALPPEAENVFDGIYRISSADSLEELAAVAADLRTRGVHIDRVISFVERTQYAAGYLATLLNADYPTAQMTLATRDKRVMKTLATQAGVAHARFRSVLGAASSEAAEVGADLGFPLVLKPAGGFGAVSTVIVRDEKELAELLAKPQLDPVFASDHMIAEEFIDGEEFCIDAVWRDAEPWVFCVTRYPQPRLTASQGNKGGELLAEKEYPALYADLLEMSRRLNGVMGIHRGATHMEAFVERGTGRLVFSEIASRMGGGNIPSLVAALCGVDERNLLAHELLGGDLADLPLCPGPFRYLGWTDVTPPRTGTVTRAPRRDDILAHSAVLDCTVFVRPGSLVDLSDSTAWYVFITFGADSREALRQAADELSHVFAIEVA
jgi:biotin carboxylase